MSDFWHIIKPAEATNLIENPSFEVNHTDGWTQVQSGAGGVWSRGGGVFSYYGIASGKITAGTSTTSFVATFTLVNGATVYAQSAIYEGTVGHARLRIYDQTNGADRVSVLGTLTGQWEHIDTSWQNTTGGDVTVWFMLDNVASDSASIVYFDAACATRGVDSTYLDGDQPGCEWNGEAHNSTSTRSALSRDGGIEYDFGTDLALWIDTEIGLSAPPVSNTFQSYAMQPGEFFNGEKKQGRPFTVAGLLLGTSKVDLHDKMKVLVDLFVTGQEVRLRHTGGTSEKWFKAVYEAGLQGSYSVASPFTQRVTLRMHSGDPDMYQVNDTNDVLDVNDTATLRYITRRKRSTGQWSDMGLTANPNIGTAAVVVNVILYASDGLVYIGGDFDAWDGNADRDFGVIYNPFTGVFSTWGAANDINGVINDIIEGPDGTIYACGAFTNVGDAAGDIIVSWTTGGAWASLGTPGVAGTGYGMAFDSSGNLHLVGLFSDFAAVVAADGYAYWTGAAWATHGAPACDTPSYLLEIAIDADDNIYVGGDCDNIGGVTYDNIAMWNGTAWVDVGLGAGIGVVFALEIANDGKTLYLGGNLANIGGVAAIDNLGLWNGTQYMSLGTAPNSYVRQIKVAPNNDIYVTGSFSSIGGYATVDKIAYWNGATWTIPDINFPGATSIWAIEFSNVDPVHSDNFDIYLGFSTTGAGYFAGDATVNNPGNADAWPTFILKRSGGTSAKLYSIRNETTGKSLLFRHGFTNGDTLTIELSKSGSVVTSSFMGNRRSAILPNSDDGSFVLQPGDNLITCFVDVAGAPTITANCLHKAVFTGIDD